MTAVIASVSMCQKLSHLQNDFRLFALANWKSSNQVYTLVHTEVPGYDSLTIVSDFAVLWGVASHFPTEGLTI